MKILLSQFLEQHHLSIRQAAIMTGVPQSTIGDIVIGQVYPTLATMEQLAAGLKTTISELYDSEHK
ncbi:MAG: helix-turn-helix transcriptional regulator [Lachnospiraceae bacterium]